jgi:hypothetical protein
MAEESVPLELSELGFMSPETVASIPDCLGTDKVALRLWGEFSGGQIRDAYQLWEVFAALRHFVYREGLGRGASRIDVRARRAFAKEAGESFSHEEVLKHRTAFALRALSELEYGKLNEVLALLRARFKKLDLEGTRDRVLKPGEEMHVDINTPANELLNLVALAEAYPENEDYAEMREVALEALVRRFIIDDKRAVEMGVKFLDVQGLEEVFKQMSDAFSVGRIGRKAGNLILAEAALRAETSEFDAEFAAKHGITTAELHARVDGILTSNESVFIGSRVLGDVLRYNKGPLLSKAARLKRRYRKGLDATEHHEAIYLGFNGKKNEETGDIEGGAEFPSHLERQLRLLYKGLHGRPCAIRSSSELEDRNDATFAGKYETEILSNMGDFEECFEKFKRAIFKVYSSVFSPDVMAYRAKHGLLMEDEEMGLLIQVFNGQWHGDYFYPDFSMVTSSSSPYSNGPDPTWGSMKIAAGAGPGIVDHGWGRLVMFEKPNDYSVSVEAEEGQNDESQMILGNPPQTEIKCIHKDGGLVTRTLDELKREHAESNAFYRASEGANLREMYFRNIVVDNVDEGSHLTLATEYVTKKLAAQYGHDVECEFTASRVKKGRYKFGWQLNLVQVRPQPWHPNRVPSRVPTEALGWNPNCVLASADGALSGTHMVDVPYVFWVDPKIFEEVTAQDREAGFKLFIDAVNAQMEDGSYFIMAPGRWGSVDASAGLQVREGQFGNLAGLCEMVASHSDSDWSGTHFGLLFTEGGKAAMRVQPNGVNVEFFRAASCDEGFEEVLDGVVSAYPSAAGLRDFVKVVDVAQAGVVAGFGEGCVLHLAQDNRNYKRPASLYIAPRGMYYPKPVAAK